MTFNKIYTSSCHSSVFGKFDISWATCCIIAIIWCCNMVNCCCCCCCCLFHFCCRICCWKIFICSLFAIWVACSCPTNCSCCIFCISLTSFGCLENTDHIPQTLKTETSKMQTSKIVCLLIEKLYPYIPDGKKKFQRAWNYQHDQLKFINKFIELT